MASRPAVSVAAAHCKGPPRPVPDTRPVDDLAAHAERAWAWWEGLGAPKLHVAPMVDQVSVWRSDRERGGGAALTPAPR